MKKVSRIILFIILLVFLISAVWDFFVNNNVRKQLNSIKVETTYKQQGNELILSIKPSDPLPRFSNNYIVILTSEYEKINMNSFKVSEKGTKFLNKEQDLYFFRVIDPDLDMYQLKFSPLKGEGIIKEDSFSVTLKSHPFSIWSNEFYLSETFK